MEKPLELRACTSCAPSGSSFGKAVLRFLHRLVDEQPLERRSPGVAGHLARVHGIGRCDGSSVYYSQRDHTMARSAYEHLLQAAGLSALPERVVATGSPRPRANLLSGVAKRFPPGDEESLVAVTQLHATIPCHPEAWFVAMTASAVQRLDAELVLVCETVSTLRACATLDWVEDKVCGRPTIALFAGGLGIFRRAAIAQVLQRLELPVLRLTHFAPYGLIDAITTPHLEDLCWPPEDALAALAQASSPTARHRAQIANASRRLEVVDHPAIAAAWRNLKSAPGPVSCDRFPGVA